MLSGKIKDASKVLSLVTEDEANGLGADLDNANTDSDSAKGPGGDININKIYHSDMNVE